MDMMNASMCYKNMHDLPIPIIVDFLLPTHAELIDKLILIFPTYMCHAASSSQLVEQKLTFFCIKLMLSYIFESFHGFIHFG